MAEKSRIYFDAVPISMPIYIFTSFWSGDFLAIFDETKIHKGGYPPISSISQAFWKVHVLGLNKDSVSGRSFHALNT